jgi:signal peptidase
MTLRRVFDLAFVVALLALFAAGALAWSNGVRPYAVDSDSMAPAFRTGALLIVVPLADADELQAGDVITFHPTPGYTATHRIVAVSPEGITTKGDANPSTDLGRVTRADVAGRVVFVLPFAGAVLGLVRQPVVLAILVLGILGGPLIASAITRRRRAMQAIP